MSTELDYSTNLIKLFNDPNAAYSVSPLFINMNTSSVNTTFDNIANPSLYLKDIVSVLTVGELPSETAQMRTNSNAILPIEQTVGNDGNAMDVKVKLTRGNLNINNTFVNVMNSVIAKVGSSNTFAATSAVPLENRNFHQDFQNLMMNIMRGICAPFFTQTRALLTPTTSTGAAPSYDNFEEAKGDFSRPLSTDKITTLMNTLENAMLDAHVFLYDNRGVSISMTDEAVFRDLKTPNSATNTTGFVSSYYYLLRQRMIDKIIFPDGLFAKIGTDPASAFLKKLTVDAYIKSQAPLIQFYYITSMIKRYNDKGDFVNARWGILTQINYVSSWLKILSDIVQSNDIAGKPNFKLRLKDMFQNLIAYLNTLNGNFESSTVFSNQSGIDATNKLLRNLQTLSAQVQRDSQVLAEQQQSIKVAQVSLRNTNEGLKEVKATFIWQMVQFYLWLFFAIAVIVTGAILIVLKKEKWVMNGSMVLAILLLLLTLVKMIFVFFF